MIKLLALDLDGTLLNSQKKISTINKDALALVRDKGVKVVITTGRPLMSIEYLLEELNLVASDEYSITFNGGLVQTNTGEVLSKDSLTLDEIKHIHEETKKLDLPLSIVSDDTVYQVDGPSDYEKVNPSLNFIEMPIEELPADRIYNKAIICYEKDVLGEQIAKLPEDLLDKYEAFKSRDIIFEFMPKGVVKSRGIAKLADILGIEQSEVMAIGDEENDLSMIDWAGLGLSMANGVDIVKETANAVIPLTNDENGIAWAVTKYILE